MNEDKYKFIKMIDAEKNISLVRNIEDGKNYIQKEYEIFNEKVYARLKGLKIKGIPHIYECEKVNGKLIVIEEYVKGRNLEEYIGEKGTFDENQIYSIALQLCDTLEILHSMNPPIIHRDIKPANIIMRKSGDIVLIDFNASREHSEGYSQDTVLFGTQNFASPEQLTGYGDSDETSDIFGLGATLSYLMTKIPAKQMIAPGKYSSIIAKCIENEKKSRYHRIAELREALINA